MVDIEPEAERVVTVECTESRAAATQKAVSADTAYGAWCSGSTLGTLLSGAMPAASANETQQAETCSGRIQRWG